MVIAVDPGVMTPAAFDPTGGGAHWNPQVELVDLPITRRTEHGRFGTITRYRAEMSDGTVREIIHGRARPRRSSTTPAVHLTIGTAPPLSLGPEGIVMHFLLKSMESGLDGIVFGPEACRTHHDEHEARAIARNVSFPASAHVAHLVCDRLAGETSTDLSHMLWTGVSLGAMKGISFAALAPFHGRTMVYSQFVVPAAPNPRPLPDADELRRFQRSELGAMARLSAELLAHDMRDRMFRINQNVLRAMRPGLMYRYAQSMPRDSISRIFTEAWRAAVCSGDAGVAAAALPRDRMATFELFDHDEAGPVAEWRSILDGVLGDDVRLVVKHGRHTDALRLSNQQDRARHIGAVLREIRNGAGIDDLHHPYA